MDDMVGAMARVVFRGIASLVMDLIGDALLEAPAKPVKRMFRAFRRRRVVSAPEVSLEKR
ncbi:hypothetical protein ACFW3D_33890 [Streptomyces sp. NPDC058864]